MIMSYIVANLVPIIGALLAMLGLGGVYLKGRKEGAAKVERREAEAKAERVVAAAKNEVKIVKDRANVETQIDRMPSGAAADQLRKHWSRD